MHELEKTTFKHSNKETNELNLIGKIFRKSTSK